MSKQSFDRTSKPFIQEMPKEKVGQEKNVKVVAESPSSGYVKADKRENIHSSKPHIDQWKDRSSEVSPPAFKEIDISTSRIVFEDKKNPETILTWQVRSTSQGLRLQFTPSPNRRVKKTSKQLKIPNTSVHNGDPPRERSERQVISEFLLIESRSKVSTTKPSRPQFQEMKQQVSTLVKFVSNMFSLRTDDYNRSD